MKQKKWILDLCSGMGGATQAFFRCGTIVGHDWGVIRIDNDPQWSHIPHTRTESVLDWMDWVGDLPPIEAVWASPPCQEFSLAAAAHRERIENPDMSVVVACLEIINHVKPRVWTLENVRGACRFFREMPDLGEYTQAIGAYYLWGKFSPLITPPGWEPESKMVHRDPALRAKVPLEISQAWVEMIVTQLTLDDFL